MHLLTELRHFYQHQNRLRVLEVLNRTEQYNIVLVKTEGYGVELFRFLSSLSLTI